MFHNLALIDSAKRRHKQFLKDCANPESAIPNLIAANMIKDCSDLKAYNPELIAEALYATMDQGKWNALILAMERTVDDNEDRILACESPDTAFDYAKEVDKCPHDVTRKIACQDPYWAWRYARDIDKGPRDDTRTAACLSPGTAFDYAKFVDKGPCEETRNGAAKHPDMKLYYETHFGKK